MMLHINKCPMCGQEPIIAKIVNEDNDFLGYQIDCDDYCLHTGCIPHYVDAVKKWNEITKVRNIMNGMNTNGINMTVNRWVAMDKRGFVLYLCNQSLSYHLGNLYDRVLNDFGEVISGTKKCEIMEHIKKWNKECHNNIAKCKAVKICITIESSRNETAKALS